MNETIKTLLERSSPRSFIPEHVSREDLELIVQAGLKSPSGRNAQTPRFIVVTNDEKVKYLSKLNAAVMGADTDPFYGAPDVIAVVVKKEACWAYDGSIALGNMLNAAYALGLGARWIHRGKEVFASEEGKAFLREVGIEEEVEGVGFCVIGRTEEPFVPKAIIPGRVFYVE